MPSSWKRALLGRPLATAAEKHERLGKISGLAVFASDALSSVAYGTEEIMLVLVAAGTGAIALLVSHHDGHRHPGRDRGRLLLADDSRLPSGGGSYIVAKDNLGDASRSRRRGGAAHRLRSHRGREHRGRGGRRHLSLPGAVSWRSRDLRRHRHCRDRRQPPGRARVGRTSSPSPPTGSSPVSGRPPRRRRVPDRDRNGPAAIRRSR